MKYLQGTGASISLTKHVYIFLFYLQKNRISFHSEELEDKINVYPEEHRVDFTQDRIHSALCKMNNALESESE